MPALRIYLLPLLLAPALAMAEEANERASRPAPAADVSREALIREPVALDSVGRRLIVANRRSGTLSILDAVSREIVAEHRVAEELAAMVAVPNAATALVLDTSAEQLLAVTFRDDSLARVEQLREMAQIPAPSRLVVSRQGSRVFVSSRWSRSITILQLSRDAGKTLGQTTIRLPFAPLELLLFDEGCKLLVADAFRGNLAIIDTTHERLDHVHQLQASNIRGLAVAGDRDAVYISHQQLNSVGRTEFDDVHWGTLLKHVVRTVPTALLTDRRGDLEASADVWRESMGRVGRGTGDPGAIWTDAAGAQAVAIAGTGKIRISHSSYRMSFPVGKRPVAFHAVGDTLFVANQFDDSITCLNLARGRIEDTISLGPQAVLTARDRGERLFFDARVAHDGWMSCHTCHSDGHSTDELVDTLGDGDYGAPKRIPSLLGVGGTGPWGWTGTVTSLEQQVAKSVHTTMHGDRLSPQQVQDLTAFLKDLEPPPSPTEGTTKATAADESAGRIRQGKIRQGKIRRGKQLFTSLGCAECHRPNAYTSSETYDVGLQDAQGRTQFNPPSLRGVAHRARLFHDGRANRLEDVFTRFHHQLEKPISKRELDQLLAFLRSL